MSDMNQTGLVVTLNEATGQVASVTLYGNEMLDTKAPCMSELWVNGLPLAFRLHLDPNQPADAHGRAPHLKGERWVDHFSGWGLVLARVMGERPGLTHRCFGIQTLVRRELCDQTLPVPGPGGPAVEAPLYVDTLSVLNWNWKFWGDDTRMVFPSAHSNGPTEEGGHAGYEDDTPERAKHFLGNVWRRIYPGVLAVHGSLFYNAVTGHWLAITCRQAGVGYIVGIENAGRGVGYDFTLHAPIGLGDSLQLPEIKLYFGETPDGMKQWLADSITFNYEQPPDWVFQTVWGEGIAWNNKPTWAAQGDYWEERIASGELSGLNYSLVTNRPQQSGTTPLGYEPDPSYGTQAEFKAMCRRLADRGVPILTWMSHSGLLHGGGAEIDDDWFIRGIDGRVCGSWGGIDQGGLTHINPGHPGYIEYTKKWIKFYIQECGCKGIFFDCLGWAFPPDFTPRPWMRFPGDTNRMAVKFLREVYAFLKECDPEAILLGEGTLLEAPVNVFSLHANPVRAGGSLGPRDFFLSLNQWSKRQIAIDQGPALAPASGYCTMAGGNEWAEHNKYLTRLLKERGGPGAFIALPGDLSLLADVEGGAMLFVPVFEDARTSVVSLPAPWKDVEMLSEALTGGRVMRVGGQFPPVPPGFYRIHQPEMPVGRLEVLQNYFAAGDRPYIAFPRSVSRSR